VASGFHSSALVSAPPRTRVRRSSISQRWRYRSLFNRTGRESLMTSDERRSGSALFRDAAVALLAVAVQFGVLRNTGEQICRWDNPHVWERR
jgi:hypothetical protein